MSIISNEIKQAVEVAMIGLVSSIFAPDLTSSLIKSFTNTMNKDRDNKVKLLHAA